MLSNIDKILERVMYSRFYNFPEKKKPYLYHNLVFVRNTLQLMLWFISLIKLDKIWIKATSAWGIFVDCQKVFDTEDHHILLKKLEYYGVRGISNECFASFLVKESSLLQLMLTSQIWLISNAGCLKVPY